MHCHHYPGPTTTYQQWAKRKDTSLILISRCISHNSIKTTEVLEIFVVYGRMQKIDEQAFFGTTPWYNLVSIYILVLVLPWCLKGQYYVAGCWILRLNHPKCTYSCVASLAGDFLHTQQYTSWSCTGVGTQHRKVLQTQETRRTHVMRSMRHRKRIRPMRPKRSNTTI